MARWVYLRIPSYNADAVLRCHQYDDIECLIVEVSSKYGSTNKVRHAQDHMKECLLIDFLNVLEELKTEHHQHLRKRRYQSPDSYTILGSIIHPTIIKISTLNYVAGLVDVEPTSSPIPY
ncbi:unnamed protein product [Cunninghamella blakesleeana]